MEVQLTDVQRSKLMKKPLSILFSLVLCNASLLAADWTVTYGELLQKYAKPSGVNYTGWNGNSDDMEKIQSVVDGIAAESLSGKSSDEKLAFYINAYNAWTLYHFLERHPYHNDNFIKRNFFFSSDQITVAGEKMSFNHLEHEIIRPQFNEPRIHFALNCASASCPPLLETPFSAATLEEDLQQVTVAYINDNPEGVKLEKDGKVAKVSQIFDWFSEDFKDGDVKSFINEYRKNPLKKETKIEFQNYDWSRNEVK